MKHKILTTLLTGTVVTQLQADNLIWSDNFDVADSGSFDAADLTGRRGGFFPTEIEMRSANQQHSLLNQQLRLGGGGAGRVRLEVPPGGAPVVSYNFGAGSAAAEILSGGGLRVEFDYVPPSNTNDQWISCTIGFPSSSIIGEPGGFRLNHNETDFGFLLRNDGTNPQFFKNNGPGNGSGTAFAATATSRHVVINYGFTSLADSAPFTVVATVDGAPVINQSHVWSNNSGQLLIELGSLTVGTLVDNFQIFEKSATRLGNIALDDSIFNSTLVQGDDIGTLSALLGGVPGGATYALVAGTGDTDNAKFQITGDKLEGGNYSFSGVNTVNGQQYSVRVQGTSTGIGAQTDEKILVLTVLKDADADGLLDTWEIEKAGNITTLSGLGNADFDGDGLTDLDEYQISLGTSIPFPVTFVNINPILADGDTDGLEDREEIEPGFELIGNLRPATNPTLADTDSDGLSDLFESNTGTYVSATNTGSNPTVLDTDLDGLGDGFETTNNGDGYDPNVDDSFLDTDGDNLSTAAEVGLGTSVILADTDGDTIQDDEEVFPTGLRPATNPTLADTDFDGLSDLVESNSTVFMNASDTGTNPAINDTDGDFARDGVELAAGSDLLLASSRPTPPASVTLVPLTDDASSGISSGKTYTHKISGGGAAVVNGVSFDVLNGGTPPPNFTWAAVNAINAVASRETIDNNNGTWVPATGNVTGTGLLSLFDSFTYSGNASAVGSKQTFTLSGLTPGQAYDLRLYTRMWDASPTSSGRPIDLVFTNGAEVVLPYRALGTDRADVMLNNGNLHEAYYLNFHYVAEGTSLVIEAKIPLSNRFVNDSGSYHLYGLTNEAIAPPALVITGIGRDISNNIIIDFTGVPSTTYDVTKSPDLVTPFGPLTIPLTATTNAGGVGQATVPASEASESREFYRIED